MSAYLSLIDKLVLLIYYFFSLVRHIMKAPISARASAPQAKPPAPDKHQAITKLQKSLTGQTVEIRNLDNVYLGYPDDISPDLERLRHACDEKLEHLITNKNTLNKFKRADFGLSAAMWYPYAKFDDVMVVMWFIIWLFVWDDDIDEKGGSVYDNFAAAEIRRNETLHFIRYCLGSKMPRSYTKPTNPIVLEFEAIADNFSKAFTTEQCQRLLKEMEVYIKGSRMEQDLRLKGKIPTIDEYWGYRLCSSAVDVTTALLEICTKTNLPQHVFNDAAMKSIWKEMNIIIAASNDMFSSKKELALGQVDNLVYLLCYNKNLRAQQAMDEADSIVRAAKAKFDKAAETLASKYPEDTILGRQVKMFVEGCKYNITGNQDWSIVSARYGLAKARRGNSIIFTL